MNEITRAYRQASVQVRTMAEKNGVNMTGRDVDKVVRSYGMETYANFKGSDVRFAHDVLERMREEADSGEMLVRCQKQAEISFRSSVAHATVDDVERLQRFARMHNHTVLNEAQAEGILRAHNDLLKQPSNKIAAAITDFQASNNIRYIAAKTARGVKMAGKAALVSVNLAQSANREDSSGLDPQTIGAQGYDAVRAARKDYAKAKGEDWVRNTRNVSKASPRHNKAVGVTGRNAAKVEKSRAAFGKTKLVWEKPVRTVAERSAELRRGAAVSDLVSKKKAKDAAAEGSKESIKSALAKWTEGSSSSSLLVFGAALYLILIVVLAIICCVVALIFLDAEARRNGLIGDWYDSNVYKTKNFVEVTQDLQRKYYNDCIAIAYDLGAEAPSYSDVKIDWKEVYCLWSAIAQYRSGNERMSEFKTYLDKDTTGYASGQIVWDLTSADDDMFNGSGDDYLQDFYLAFYSMYYDLKALDYHGNPILIDIYSNCEKYYPYYPAVEGGTGTRYNFANFNYENGFPLKGERSGNIVTGLLIQNKDGSWELTDAAKGHYYFSWASTSGAGGTELGGYLNRGRPKITVDFVEGEEKFESNLDAPLVWEIEYQGCKNDKLKNDTYRADFGATNSYSSCEDGGKWYLKNVYQKSGDGELHKLTGTTRQTVVGACGQSLWIYNSTIYANSNWRNCQFCHGGYSSYVPEGTVCHTHTFTITQKKYKDLFYQTTQVHKYIDPQIKYPSPSAEDGLKALHDVYDKVFMTGYYNGGQYSAYGQGKAFFLGGHHVVSDDCVIEKGRLVSSGHDHICVILDEIFDRSDYYPWGTGTLYPRTDIGLPGGSGHDCYSSIDSLVRSLHTQAVSNTINGVNLPYGSNLCAYFDTASNSKVNNYAAYNHVTNRTGKEQWDSVTACIAASVKDAQFCFPFYVNKDPKPDGLGSWINGYFSNSDSEKMFCVYPAPGYWDEHPAIVWNSVSYTLYKYFVAEQNMCPPAACGVLGALMAETGFDASGYRTMSKDPQGGAYAIGLIQWNMGIQPEENDYNFYSNRLPSWCEEHGYYWKNSGAQLQFLSECIANGDTTGDYPNGVYNCQMLNNTYQGKFGGTVFYSGYTRADGNPTFSAADSAGCYESCYYWSRMVEVCVEGVGLYSGGTPIVYGYGDIDLLYALDAGTVDKSGNRIMNMDKQRMVYSHMYLRYIAASDPDYYSVVYYDSEVWGTDD